jgi:hypothetical protein
VTIGIALAATVVWLLWRRPRVVAVAPAPVTATPVSEGTALFGVGVVAVVFAQWSARLLYVVQGGVPNRDTLWHHMPLAARFVQQGWITRLHFTHDEPFMTYYALDAELFHGIGMLAFGRDSATPLLNMAFLVLALLAGWCIGRPRGVAPFTMVAVATVLAVPTLAATQAGDASSDIVALAFFLAALGLLAHAGSPFGPGAAQTGVFGLAGVAAGTAAGSKLSLLLPVAVLTIAVLVCARGAGWRRRALIWMTALAATGGFWYVRNLVLVGNPLPWVDVGVGGLRLPSVELHVTGDTNFSVAHYATDVDVWNDYFRPWLSLSFGRGWALLLVLAFAGMALAVRRGRGRWDHALGLVGLGAAIAYALTPLTAGGPEGMPNLFPFELRFLTPALCVGLVLVALHTAPVQRSGRAVVGGAFAALFVLAVSSPWPFGWHGDFGPVAVSAGAVVFVVGAAALWIRARAGSGIPPAITGGVLGVAALVALVANGALQDRYLERRYRSAEFEAGPAYRWGRDVRDAHIAVAGLYDQYPFYGTDLSNHVQYVGRQYSGGNFTVYTTCDSWRRALRDGDYDYAAVYSSVREAAWTATDPAARPVVQSGSVHVFALDRSVPLTRCSAR